MDEKQQKAKEFLMKLGWILFLIAVAFVIGMIIGPKLVHALDWPFGQQKYCEFAGINSTQNQSECDRLWCMNVLNNSTQSCNYSSFCLCSISINNTIIMNQTANVTISNVTGNLALQQYLDNSTNLTIQWCRQYVDNNLANLSNNVAGNMENTSKAILQKIDNLSINSAAPTNWTAIIILVSIIIIGLAYVSYNSLKRKQFEGIEPEEPIIRPGENKGILHKIPDKTDIESFEKGEE